MSIDFDDVTSCDELNSKSYKDSDSDICDKEEPSTDDIREACHKMYKKWLKICEKDKSLKNGILKLGKENELIKGASANWKNLLREKDKKTQELMVELENT